jgi:hypothetical protein
MAIVPPVGEASFAYGAVEPISEPYINPAAPMSIGSQLCAVSFALAGRRSADPGLVTRTYELVQAALAAPEPSHDLAISEMPPRERSPQVVFAHAGSLVVGPSVEAPTEGVLDLTVEDVRAVQAGYELAATIPGDKRQGNGAEVLSVLPDTDKAFVIHALRTVARGKARVHSDAALLGTEPEVYYADQAKEMLEAAGIEIEPTIRTRCAEAWLRARRLPRIASKMIVEALADMDSSPLSTDDMYVM